MGGFRRGSVQPDGPAAAARCAAVLVVLVAPLLLTLASIAENAPVVAGEPARRTIVASEQVQVRDEEATAEAEQQTRSSVADVYNLDQQAQAEIVQQTRAVFDAIEAVVEPETVAGVSAQTAGFSGGSFAGGCVPRWS